MCRCDLVSLSQDSVAPAVSEDATSSECARVT
jgi:hypothetical protein